MPRNNETQITSAANFAGTPINTPTRVAHRLSCLPIRPNLQVLTTSPIGTHDAPSWRHALGSARLRNPQNSPRVKPTPIIAPYLRVGKLLAIQPLHAYSHCALSAGQSLSFMHISAPCSSAAKLQLCRRSGHESSGQLHPDHSPLQFVFGPVCRTQ